MSVIKVGRKAPFTVLPNALINDPEISADELGFMAYLLSKPEGWVVRPAQLAQRFGMGREKAYRILNDLIGHEWIQKSENKTPEGKFSSVDYIVLSEKPFTENPDTEKPDTENQHPSKERELVRTEKDKRLKDSFVRSEPLSAVQTKSGAPPLRPVLSERYEFDAWYAGYPHKVGRAAAEKAFQAARKKASLGELLDGLHAYIANKPPDHPWCNPATWLNQARWLDQPAKPEIAGNGQKSISDDEKARFLAEWKEKQRHARQSGQPNRSPDL